MTEKPTNSMQLVLTNDSATGRVTVDMEAFFDFSFWMAEELEDLVQCWRHKAAPRSAGLRDRNLPSETA